MQNPQQIHPDQWEVINGEARPKNDRSPFCHVRTCKQKGTGCTCEYYENFEQFATQHTYKSPGISDGTHEASELVFKYDFFNEVDLRWEPCDNDEEVRFRKRMGYTTRQIIALAETQVTPPASPLESKEETVLLKLGIEAISLIKADGLYNQDLEAGRADTLSDTEPVTIEELTEIDGVEADEEHLKFYNDILVPKERDRLHKQAYYVAKGLVEYLKLNPITPTTLLSEGKESVRKAAEKWYFKEPLVRQLPIMPVILAVEYGAQWQSQTSAKEMAEITKEVTALQEQFDENGVGLPLHIQIQRGRDAAGSACDIWRDLYKGKAKEIADLKERVRELEAEKGRLKP